MFRKSRRYVSALVAIMMLLSMLPGVMAANSEEAAEEIIIEEVNFEVRDGTSLYAKVYRPKGDGPYPVLLTRTPYNAAGDYAAVGNAFARKGYAVVVNDVRGLFGSDGEYRPYMDDAEDGYDTVVWAAKQPWSNGKVGTFGASARGVTQTLLATQNPPGLEAMFVIIASSQYYEEVLFQGGAYRHELITRWLAGVNVSNAAKLLEKGEIDQEAYEEIKDISEKGFPDMYEHMPLSTFPYLNMITTFNASFDHYIKDGFFDYRDMTLHYSHMDVPAYHVGGWYDIYTEGTVKNYVNLQQHGAEGARGNQKLLMGPWQHRDIGNSPLFDGDEVDINGEMERWFDYWLKGIDNGIMDEEPIQYYTMGSNEWKSAKKWPVPGATQRKFYFNEGTSGSADSLNDGKLSMKMPRPGEEPDVYEYDPADPIETIGGQNLYLSYGVGPMDQRPAEKDALTYTSEKLKEDVEITGKVKATLYVSSDALDTDFTVKLTDVAPDGTSMLLNDGILRMRSREGTDKEVFMKDGEVYKIEVELTHTSHVFKKGHQIRVAVASSNFPRFDRNPNTGNAFGVDNEEDFVIATNAVHHNPKNPSHIVLPIVNKK